ncbi:ABC transporter permease [Dactylosporangium sp. NPDC005572]|uniref:ABC transporter permease n=1 Tax=Dactylosporangium sp. NPDC005572 TaxID=3156889 RepID=UPI0033B4DF81
MTPTLLRLAFAGIRSRLLAATLTVMITASAAGTLVIALEVRGSGVDPWQRTFQAAHGAHVLAVVPSPVDAQTIAELPGVAERDDAVPSAVGTATIGGHSEALEFAGLAGRPRINAPVRTEGTAQPGSGVVLERSLANALHVAVGSLIEVPTPTGAVRLPVVGTAVSPSQPRYPRRNPGLGWVSRDTLQRIQPDQSRWQWTQPVRLTDPAAAPQLRDTAMTAVATAAAVSWQDQRDEALLDSQPITVVLGMFTVLLLTVVFAVIGILTAARVSAQYRDIGLLKAIGLTPRQVSAVFLLEAAVLGLAAVAIGFPVGAALAPRLAAPSAQTLVSSPGIAIQPWHALLASGVVLPVLLLSAFLAVRRTTRSTTLNAIRAGAPAPVPTGWLARAVTRVGLPLPATLGLKDLIARRRRTLWTATAVAVAGAVIVATLQMRAAVRIPVVGTVSDVPAELTTLVYSLDAVLVVIAATALVAVMVLSVRERIRDLGVLKAIGLTPAQLTAGLVSAQGLLATGAALLSIPLGTGLYLAVLSLTSGTVDGAVLAPWWQVALVPVGVAAAVAVTTGPPARLAAQIPVTEAVRYE